MDELISSALRRSRRADLAGRVVARTIARIALLAAALVTALSFRLPAVSAAERTLTLAAESAVEVPAELARVRFDFTGYGWSVAKAQANADRAIRKFLDKLKEKKVEPAKVSKGNLKLRPSYQFNRDLKVHVPSDFIVSREVTVELEDLSLLGKLMDASLAAGSFVLESARLTVKDEKGLALKAFEAGVAEGRRKGEGLAESLGGKLGAIVSVEETAAAVEEADLIRNPELATLASGSSSDAESKETAAHENVFIVARSRLKLTFYWGR